MKNMWAVYTLFILAACLTIALSGTHPDGISKVSREQDALGNYKFSYAVSNNEGEHFREEGTDDLGRVVGSYGLTHKDGTQRVVDYIADKDGFRAEVRSNEPGMASSENGDATLLKLHPDLPLAVAATAIDSSQSAYGTRLKADTSRVSYVGQDEEKAQERERLDNTARESRQRNFDDYRPGNPVAYYPDRSADPVRPLGPPAYDSAGVQRRPRTQNHPSESRPLSPPPYESTNAQGRSRSQDPIVESRPLDIYLPPINPHSAARRPPYIDPAERTPDRSLYTTTSRRPFIPPYGGFDDDPLPVGRRPGISMSTIHGGLDTNDFHPPQTSTPAYGAGRYPSNDVPLSRDFIRPRFPPRLPGSLLPPGPRSGHPGGSLLPQGPRGGHPGGSLLPQGPRGIPPSGSLLPQGPGNAPPGSFFGPPSYDPARKPPNFVLRAVPIPNGIQAVRVDPETGRVHERVMYPLYLRQDGYPEYDRNVLLHNDDVSDDGAIRNDNPSYVDFPYRRRLPFRSARTTPLNFNEEFGNRSRIFNESFVDPQTLSIPTARDLSWIQRQLSLVEGFDRSRFPNPSFMRNRGFENSEYPLFNDFDDSSNESPDDEDSPYSRNRNSDRSEFSRNPRHYDRLQIEDTKAIIVSESENAGSNTKVSETDPKPVIVEKE